MSYLEKQLIALIKQEKLPIPKQEYRFEKKRKWRFDFAYPEQKIAIEIEGGIWTQGRHTRGQGFINDCEKYNTAVLAGWRVLRYHADSLGQSVEDLKIILKIC